MNFHWFPWCGLVEATESTDHGVDAINSCLLALTLKYCAKKQIDNEFSVGWTLTTIYVITWSKFVVDLNMWWRKSWHSPHGRLEWLLKASLNRWQGTLKLSLSGYFRLWVNPCCRIRFWFLACFFLLLFRGLGTGVFPFFSAINWCALQVVPVHRQCQIHSRILGCGWISTLFCYQMYRPTKTAWPSWPRIQFRLNFTILS